MGRDKARLRLGGRSFLAHIRDACRGAGLSVRVLRRDLHPGCGPLGGVQTALRSTHFEFVLFLSCDMPLVPPRLLRKVLASVRKGRRAAFVGVEYAGFPFALPREALASVEQNLSSGRWSLQDLAGDLGANLVAPGEDSILLCNVNTPAELVKLREVFKTTAG